MAQNKTIIEAHKRMTLEVVSITKDQQVGRNAQKLSFKAKAEDKELTYASFVRSLHDHIKASVGKTIDCDVEVSEHEYDGQMYQDRLVLDIFMDGKSLRQEQRGGSGGGGQQRSGGGGYREDSPEKIASIEAQTAYNGAIQLLVAKVINTGSDLGTKALDWAISRIDNSMKGVAPSTQTKESKSLVEAAKEMGAQEVSEEEITPEEIDWGGDENAPNIDKDALDQLMEESNWKESTIKSWCKSQLKVDRNDQPLNTSLELMPFLRSMSKDSLDKLFKMMASKRRT